MGQKVSPIAFRLGINRDWSSHWYASKKNFGKNLIEDYKIREIIAKSFKNLGISDVIISKSDNLVVIDIHTSKPGIILGKSGVKIIKLKKDIAQIIDNSKSKEIRINVKEIKKIFLDAKIVAELIGQQISNHVSFRIAQKKLIRQVLKSGAKGIKTKVSGRLGGVDIARTEGYVRGKIPLHTFQSLIDYASVAVHTSFGKIGVKVWIYKGPYISNNHPLMNK